MENMKNNLFEYATSELSQDAFICWLMSYAEKSCTIDEELKSCAVEFTKFFIFENECEEEVYVTGIEKQVPVPADNGGRKGFIDILLTVNEKYKVIIEDKKFTSEHDDQIKRYMTYVEDTCPGYIVKAVYYKTGFEALEEYDNKKIKVCDRKKILEIMGKYIKKIDNNIFADYYNYWHAFDEDAEQFRTLPVNEWNERQIQEFYSYYHETYIIGGKANIWNRFNYVPQVNGGYYDSYFFVENRDENRDKIKDVCGIENCEVYYQCEFDPRERDIKITFRASCSEDNQKKHLNNRINKEVRNKLIYHNGENILEKYGFEKPDRYRCGISAAIGKYQFKAEYYTDIVNALEKIADNYDSLFIDLGGTI